MDRLRIVVIDDDTADIKLLKRLLMKVSTWDAEVTAFTSWQEADPVLKKMEVEVIFVDYLLGRDTGLEIVTRLRARGDDRPVIMLTGKGDEIIAAETMRAGADDYLVKHMLDADTLRRATDNAIAQFMLRREKALLVEQLQQSQKMESIGTLAGGIAHDFNNMLAAIIGCLELALLKSQQPEVVKYLHRGKTVCGQMVGVVRQLLHFSRSGGTERENVDLYALLQGVKMILDHTLPKTTQLHFECPEEGLIANLNGAMLQQVLLNLCLNASDAMPEGGLLRVTAERVNIDADSVLGIDMVLDGEILLLKVQDSGVGMEEKVLSRIYEPFYTGKKLGTKKGTGLGLAIVWDNIQKLGGGITVKSKPGSGTTFSVYLPLGTSADQQPAENPASYETSAGSETILVVDDESVVLEMTTQMLEQLGYQVHSAASGGEALNVYAESREQIDLILLDMSMPRMDGKKCLVRLREINPEVKVLFISGQDIKSAVEELITLGAKGVLQKPYSINELSHRVSAVIGGQA